MDLPILFLRRYNPSLGSDSRNLFIFQTSLQGISFHFNDLSLLPKRFELLLQAYELILRRKSILFPRINLPSLHVHFFPHKREFISCRLQFLLQLDQRTGGLEGFLPRSSYFLFIQCLRVSMSLFHSLQLLLSILLVKRLKQVLNHPTMTPSTLSATFLSLPLPSSISFLKTRFSSFSLLVSLSASSRPITARLRAASLSFRRWIASLLRLLNCATFP